MSSPQAELSSIYSSLEQLAARVASLGSDYDTDPENHIAPALFEVDRSLRGALRQLERVQRSL